MHVEILDPELGRYRCEYGEFNNFPDRLLGGPPPHIAAFSRWSARDGRLRRRNVDGITYVDVDHEGLTWTYQLDPAWTAIPAERIPAFYQQLESFDVGILPD